MFVRSWRALGLRGLASVTFGLLALVWPQITLVTVVILFGTYVLVDAVLTLAASARPSGRHRFSLLSLEAFVGIVVGMAALMWPTMTAVILVVLGGAWAIITGAVEIALGFGLRRHVPHAWLLGLAGGVSVGVGLLMIAWPTITGVVFVSLFGAYALLFGAVMLALALRLRRLSIGGREPLLA